MVDVIQFIFCGIFGQGMECIKERKSMCGSILQVKNTIANKHYQEQDTVITLLLSFNNIVQYRLPERDLDWRGLSDRLGLGDLLGDLEYDLTALSTGLRDLDRDLLGDLLGE